MVIHAYTCTVSGDPVGFGPEQTFSKEVDDKANAYFQVFLHIINYNILMITVSTQTGYINSNLP